MNTSKAWKAARIAVLAVLTTVVLAVGCSSSNNASQKGSDQKGSDGPRNEQQRQNVEYYKPANNKDERVERDDTDRINMQFQKDYPQAPAKK